MTVIGNYTMTTYSFKHVGVTRQERKTQESHLLKTAKNIGIKTPLREGNKEFFEMNETVADQVIDNYRNMLLTNWGERVNRYRYGGNLRPLLSEYSGQESFNDELLERIRNSTATWFPFIELDEMTVVENEELSNKRGLPVIDLYIKFDIPALNVRGKVLQLTLHAL